MKNDGLLQWCSKGEHFLEDGEVLYGNSCLQCLLDEGEEVRQMNDYGMEWIKNKGNPREDN